MGRRGDSLQTGIETPTDSEAGVCTRATGEPLNRRFSGGFRPKRAFRSGHGDAGTPIWRGHRTTANR
jgi:hypothetical protein